MMAEKTGIAEGGKPPSRSSRTQGLTTLSARWIDAWNRRDVGALLAIADPAIELRPLRLRGLGDRYGGHDGIRAWMDSIVTGGHEHRIEPVEFTEIRGGRVLVEGTVTIEGRFTSPFSGVYDFVDQRMTQMAHYFTPRSLLESIGVLDSR